MGSSRGGPTPAKSECHHHQLQASPQGVIKVIKASLWGIIKASLWGIIKASLGVQLAVGGPRGEITWGAERGAGKRLVVPVHCATRSAEKLIISGERL